MDDVNKLTREQFRRFIEVARKIDEIDHPKIIDWDANFREPDRREKLLKYWAELEKETGFHISRRAVLKRFHAETSKYNKKRKY